MTEFAVDLRRTIAAPRAEVYRAFLDPEILTQWMCPTECVVTTAEVDERVGGRHVVEMLGSDGSRFAFESVIRELVEHERIVLDFRFAGSAQVPDEVTCFTASFRDAGEGATEIRLEHEQMTFTPPHDEQSVTAGWTGVLDKLEALYERS